MLKQSNLARAEASILTGDAQSLAEQLGSVAGLGVPGVGVAAFPAGRIDSLPALRDFLLRYQAQILIPLELPAISRACILTSEGKARELIELDRSLAGEPALRDFAAASWRAGQSQLRRLRPLRDHRVAQRYLRAVENGAADGWHSLAFGVTLAVFSLPLRQGLLHYARQTGWGFIQAAHRTVEFSEGEDATLLGELSANWPPAIEAALAPPSGRPAPIA